MSRVGSRESDPERRILDDIGSDSGVLAFVDISNADLLFLGPALLVTMILFELVVLATGRFFVGVGLALVVLGIAGIYVYVCPDHRTPLGLLQSFLTHNRRETTMRFTATAASTATDPGTDTPADVRELTRVRAVEPDTDAIRRADKTLIGAVRIEPANLALADDDQWDRAARKLGEVLNTLAYPVQIRSAAHRVDPGRMTAAYDDRRTDSDVQSTPALETIVEVYRRRRPQEFRKRGTSIRQHHAIVGVDIQAVSLADHAWVRRLKSAPLVGERLASLLADCVLYRTCRETIEERQRAILEERRSHLTDQLSSVQDISARPIAASDLVELVEAYWTGRRTEYASDGPGLRTPPVVMAAHDAEEHRSPTESTTVPSTEADQE